MNDPYDEPPSLSSEHDAAHFRAVRHESGMLAMIAGAFFLLGFFAALVQSSQASQAMMICSFVAAAVIGGWSLVRYLSVKSPPPKFSTSMFDAPLSGKAIVSQVVSGFFLGLLAWISMGMTLIGAFFIVIGALGTQNTRCSIFIAGLILGFIFPPLAIFSLCYFAR